jgi:hypothetical protein
MGKLSSFKSSKDEIVAVPKDLVGRDVVNCPMTSPIRSVVEVSFCKNKCKWFSRIIEDTTGNAPNRIACMYPRYLEVVKVCGEEK